MTNINITNLFDLSCNQINKIKKTDPVNHMKNLKGKVAVGVTIKDFCNELIQL